MSNQTQTARVKPIAASNPTVYNLAMPTANTEYAQALNNSVKKVMVRMRTPGECRMAFIATNTATEWITILPGAVYSEENLDLNNGTIYLRSNVSSQIAEILEWT